MKSAAAPDWVNIIRHSTYYTAFTTLTRRRHGEWLELLRGGSE